MSNSTSVSDPLADAIEKARHAFSKLPDGDQVFKRCLDSPLSIIEAVEQARKSQKASKSTQLLEGLQKHTSWLQNLSSVVDVAVQTQAGLTCPIWAPLKFVLLVVDQHSKASEEIVRLLDTVVGCVRQIKLYKELGLDPTFQIPLLALFTDIVDFSLNAIKHFRQRTIRRLAVVVFQPYKYELSAMRERIRDHAADIRDAIIARELLEAKRYREEETAERRRGLKSRCERWLRPSALKDVHERRLQLKTEGTCQWIQNHNIFVQWRDKNGLDAPGRILSISGTHGCGKSILASAITSKLQNEGRRVLYFYFSSTDANRRTSDNVGRSFLAQLLNQDFSGQVCDYLASVMNRDTQPSSSDLWRALETVLCLEPLTTFLVLDGLDEAAEQQEIWQSVSTLLENVAQAKCVLLSRPTALEALRPPLTTQNWQIPMEPSLTQADLESFVTKEIDEITLIKATDLRDDAMKAFHKKSSSSFLWVQLMASDLKKACTEQELKQRLDRAPQGLLDVYRLLFLRIKDRRDKIEIQRTRIFLAVVIVARRPLRTDELIYALALWTRSISETKGAQLHEYVPLDPEKTVLAACGDMVTISGGLIHLNHSSVQEFLCRGFDEWTTPEDRDLIDFRVDIVETNGLFATLCLDYLDLENLGYPLKEPDTLLALRAAHPFVEYTSYNIFYHLQKSRLGFAGALEKLRKIASKPHFVSWLEHSTIAWTEDAFSSDISMTDNHNEEFVHDWHTMLNCDEEIRRCAKAQLRNEIAVRTKESDPTDYRTAILSKILFFIAPSETLPTSQNDVLELIARISNDDCDEEVSLAPQVENAGHAASTEPTHQDLSVVLSDVAKHLKNGYMVPSHSIAMMLRMWQYTSRIHKVKDVDPLVVLFELVLASASTLPVWVVLGICDFYDKLDKHDQVLQLCNALLPRVDGRGSRAESVTYRFMGIAHYRQDQNEEAVQCMKRAVSVKEPFWLKEHNRISIDRTLVRGDPYDKLDFLEELLEMDQKRYGKQAKATLETQVFLAYTSRQLGDEDEAMDLFQTIWLLGKKRHAHDSRATYHAGREIGLGWQKSRDLQQARRCFEDLRTWVGPATKDNYDWYCGANEHLAEVFEGLSQPDDALRCLQESYLATHKFTTKWNYYLLEQMIHSLIGTEKYKQAKDRKQLLLANSQFKGQTDEEVLDALHAIADALELYHQYEEALLIGLALLAEEMEKVPNDLTRILSTQRLISANLEYLDRFDEAIANRRKVVKALKEEYGELHEEHIIMQQELARALYNANRMEEALECWGALDGFDADSLPADLKVTIDQCCTLQILGVYDSAHEAWNMEDKQLSWPVFSAVWDISTRLLDASHCRDVLCSAAVEPGVELDSTSHFVEDYSTAPRG